MNDEARILVKVARAAGLIAHLINNPEDANFPLPGVSDHYHDLDSGKDIGVDAGAHIAIANFRYLDDCIHKAQTAAKSVPESDLITETRVALTMAHEALGQANVPAEMMLTDDDADGAIKCIEDALRCASERVGVALEKLQARLLVAGETAAPRPPSEHKGGPFYPPQYFDKKWQITPEQLRNAHRDGDMHRRQPKPNVASYHYSETDARRLWPHKFAPPPSSDEPPPRP